MLHIAGLRSGAPPAAGIFMRPVYALKPAFMIVIMHIYGLPQAIWMQLKKPNPINWLNPFHWRDLILAAFMPTLLKGADENSACIKRPLIGEASGKVVEIGAGTGLTFKYYKEKVTSLYAIEPFEPLHAELRQSAAALGPAFESKLHVVPYGIHQKEQLRSAGVEEGTFDTVVLVQVLCSIPEPQAHLAYLQSLLKPGGKLLMYEHVKSTSTFTSYVQLAYTPLWKYLTKGCCLNRPSGEWITNLGGWKEAEILRPSDETSGNVIPHDVGRFVKA